MTFLSLVGEALLALSCCASVYYHTCSVDYRREVPESSIPNWQEQSLDKYKYPHIGWQPDQYPPDFEFDFGWYETKPFLGSDGKTVLQQFASKPKSCGGVRSTVREKCLSKGSRSAADLKQELERCPTVDTVSGSPKAVCILLPGLGDSILRNAHLADRLACSGYAAHGMDYPGWGMSQRQAELGSDCVPGLNFNWDRDVCDEVMHFTKLVKKAYPPGTKFFVVAASLGGATALRCSIKDPELFDGAVVLCPAVASDVKPHLQAIAPLVGRIFPRLPLGELGDADIGSRNLYCAHKITHDKCKSNLPLLAATGAAILGNFKFLKQNMDKMKVPFLVIHGEKDMITDISGSHLLMEKASSSDKMMRTYKHAWHDLLFEPEWEEVCNDITVWLDRHADGKGKSSMPACFKAS